MYIPRAASFQEVQRHAAWLHEQQPKRVEDAAVDAEDFIDDVTPCIGEAEIAGLHTFLPAMRTEIVGNADRVAIHASEFGGCVHGGGLRIGVGFMQDGRSDSRDLAGWMQA